MAQEPQNQPIYLDSSFPSSFEAFLQETLGSTYSSFPVSHAVLPGFGGSLIAKRSILSGEDVLRIPEKLFITLTVALDQDKELKLASSKISSQRKSILAFFLYLNKNNPECFYNPYLESIPKEYSNPITWNEEQLNVMRKELKEKYYKKQQRLIEEFQNLKEFIINSKEEMYQKILERADCAETTRQNNKENLSEQQLYYTQIQLLKQFNEQQFLQFISMVESRTLFFKNREDPNSEVGAMVPFYDLANHSFMKGVDHFALFSFNSETREYILRAYKDLQKGDQIFITYGNYNNEHFLEYYGFIPFENTQEALKFHVESKELLNILGYPAKEKIKKNQFIISQALSHLCNPTTKTLRETINVEVEDSGEYSWETNTLLQLLSIDFPVEDDKKKDVKPTVVVGDSNIKRIIYLPEQKKQSSKSQLDVKSGKISAGKNSKKSPTTDELSEISADKKRLSILLEAVTSGELESLDIFNAELFNMYKLNLRGYLISLYDDPLKQEHLLRNKSDEKENQQHLDEITQLACSFTKHEIEILNKSSILKDKITEKTDKHNTN